MTNPLNRYDTLLLGSSVNALTLAAYLAKAGQRVLILEPTAQFGGAFNTSEFAPGFRADLSLISGRLDNKIVQDLQLAERGLQVIERNTITSLLPTGSFTLSNDSIASASKIVELSQSDGARYHSFLQLLDMASELLKTAYAMTPPQAHHPTGEDAQQLNALASQLRGYGRREMPEVMRLLVMSVRDLLDEWFESAVLKGLLGSLAIRGLTQGPFAAGTTFNLLHHLAIGDGYFRASAKGGSSAIIQSLINAAIHYGAELRNNVGQFQIATNDGVCVGVKLAEGELISATRVISDYDARHTFTKLIDPPELTPEFNRAVRHVRYNGSVARVNLALRELPQFISNGNKLGEEALRGTMVLAPSLAYLEKAFDRVKYREISTHPYLEFTIPSLADDTLAPAGGQVISVWLQYAPYLGQVDAHQIRELVLTQLSEFAPNLRSLVVESQVITPKDFERDFNLTEGHLYGSDMTLSQAFFLRPLPGYAQYQTPIEQLYMCGAATHPGGGISGLAGRNLAHRLINSD